jgi:transposase InsO family protein
LIRTDHGALKWLLTFKNPEAQVARWIEVLGNYQFEIQHRAGKLHGNADGLSRQPCAGQNCKQCDKMLLTNTTEKDVHVPKRLPKNDKNSDQLSTPNETQENAKTDPTGSTSSHKIRSIKKESKVDDSWVQSFSKEELREAQMADPEVGEVVRCLEGTEGRPKWNKMDQRSRVLRRYYEVWDDLLLIEGVLYKRADSVNYCTTKNLLVLPNQLRKGALLQLHDNRVAGHFGRKKTLQRVRERYFWIGYNRDITEWVDKCPDCIQKRRPTRACRAEMQIHNVCRRRERVSMDILGPLPESERNNKYILCVGDHFTKWITSVAIPNQQAKTVAEALIEHVFSIFGVPTILHSDQGASFEANLIKELCEMFGIKRSRTTPYRPNGNGFIERWNLTMQRMLRIYSERNQKDWDTDLPYVMMAYRSSVQDSTGFTPNELMLGWDVKMPIDIIMGTPSSPSIDDDHDLPEFVERQREHMLEINEEAMQNNFLASQRQKHFYDKKAAKVIKFEVGQKVWYYRPKRVPKLSPKLTKFWEGPYTVIDRISDILYRIGLNSRRGFKTVIVHVDKLKTCHETHLRREDESWSLPGPSGSAEKASSAPPPGPKISLTKSGRTKKHPQWYGIVS